MAIPARSAAPVATCPPVPSARILTLAATALSPGRSPADLHHALHSQQQPVGWISPMRQRVEAAHARPVQHLVLPAHSTSPTARLAQQDALGEAAPPALYSCSLGVLTRGPSCECTAPPATPAYVNGSSGTCSTVTSGNPLAVGSTCTASCASGYGPLIPSTTTYTCTGSTSYSGAACPQQCSTPPTLAAHLQAGSGAGTCGSVSSSPIADGDTCTVSCASGYVPTSAVGTDTYSCSNGAITGSLTCGPAPCTTQPAAASGVDFTNAAAGGGGACETGAAPGTASTFYVADSSTCSAGCTGGGGTPALYSCSLGVLTGGPSCGCTAPPAASTVPQWVSRRCESVCVRGQRWDPVAGDRCDLHRGLRGASAGVAWHAGHHYVHLHCPSEHIRAHRACVHYPLSAPGAGASDWNAGASAQLRLFEA